MADPKAAMAAILEKYSPKSSKSGTTGSKAAETESTSKAKKAMDEILKKYSPKPDVRDALPGLRGKETEIFKPSPIYDYTGASRKKSEAKQGSDQKIEYDSGSVLKLGAGPLSNNAVTSGVVSGKLELTSQNKDGKYSVEKNTEYVAPKKKADIIDRSPARMAELEAVKNPSEAQIEELAIIKKELAEKAEAAKLKEERELGDNWFSWLGKSRDSTLPLSTADTQAQKAIGNTVGALTQNVAGSLMSVIATLNELDARTRARDEADSAKLKAAQSALEKGEEVDLGRSEETWRADMTAKTDEYTAKVKNDLAHEFSGILMNNAEQLRNEAYRAAGDEGKFLVDLLYTGGQMAVDLIANVIVPGSGLWLMSARVFGQSAYEARENGADAATQFVTGLKSAIIEYLTEKMGGGAFKRIYGAGMVDNAIESVLGRLFKTNTGRTVIRYIMTAVNEGNEEVLSDVLNPVADRLLGLDDGEGSLFTDEDLGQMWYDWMLGTALGGIGAAVNIAGGSNAEQNADLRLTESAQKALVESGLESDTNTESYKLAEKYKKTLDSGRLLSNKQVKKLTEANDAAIRNEVALQSAIDAVKETVPERAARMFAERGEQASPELISGITNLITDQQVTQEQVAAIVASDNSAEVVQQLAQEYITQEAPDVQESAPVDGPMETWDGNNIVESMFPNEVKNGILNEQDVADIQHFYDYSGRSIDLNELETMERDYIENKKEAKTNEGRKQSSDGGVGREPDVGAGEQAGRIPKSAGRNKSEKRENDTRGEETRRPAGQKPQREKVSGKSLNIPNGTDSQKLTVVKPDGVNARIVEAFSAAAKSITLVNGAIEQQKNDAVITVSGLTTADGRVFARADHRLYNGTKLLLHECGHLYMDDAQMRREMHNAAAELLSERTLEEMANSYALLWKGLYKMPAGITTDEELADYFENDPDAYAQFLEVYEQEIWCDALAGLDRIKAAGASKLTDTVRSIFKDYTGIDVDAILSGADTGNTAVKTGQGKAERIAPRNNGPPEERYSYGGENARTANIKTLEEAKRLENDSIDSETIRQQTGWHRGYDGKWRFEIDDSSAYFEKEPNLETHYANTDVSYQTGRLGDIFRHRDLYEAYPHLEDYIVIIQETETGNEGAFFPGRNEIVLSRELFKRYTKEYKEYLNGGRIAEIKQIESTPEYKEYSIFYDDEELLNLDPEDWLELEEVARKKFFSSELGKRYYQLQWGKTDIRKYETGWSDAAKSVLLHEIQHAVQNIERTSKGSSPSYWNRRIEKGLSVYRNDRRIEAADREYRDIFENAPEIFKNKVREINRARLSKDYDTAERIVDELYESEYSDLYSRLDMADFIRRGDRGEKLTAGDLYELTAGEIEARDTEKRGELTAEQRKNTRPDIDRADVVFADDGVSYSADDVELNYESLVKKPDMILTTVVNSYGMSRKDIVSEGKTNAASVGYVNESGVPVVLIKDTKSEIRVTNKGLRHGLRRKYLDNGSVTAKAGEILSNSIKINELSARKNSPNGSNVLIGAARRGKNIYIVRSIVSKGSNELEEIDTLYAIDTKIESAALNAPGNPDNPFPVTNSKISIAKLLEYVNRYFPDILPTDVLMHFGREARPNSSVSNSAVYSADDALLVEGDPDYADTLSKVREDARRYNAGKLEERISSFDGRIKGYEETENRTERMELELEDLRNRRKVYSDALKRKKAKNDERRQANETAKTEAKATAQRITEAQGRNRSKATLRDTIFRDFNIQEGRSEAADVINAFADKYAEQGRISRKDLNGLFDTLMEKGLFVAEAEDYARELRAHLAGSSVRVPSYVKAEFGDDWINFYRRAWGNKIYLKIDSGSNGIDTWTQELAGSFGEGTFDTSADLKTQLERIVELAEQGRDEKMDLFHMAEYVRKREGRDTADAIVDELYQKLENAVKTYASNAKLEMELTYKNAFQQARDRAIRQENARRAQEKKELRERQQDTLKQLQILKRMRDTTSQEFREQIDRVLDGIDTIAVSAANAMNYSDKYNATWGSIVAMYNEAKANDPNWLPDAYVDKLMERIDGRHLDKMEPADLEQLYQAAVALRTKIYNTRNIIGSETNMLFDEAYDSVRGEMHGASKPKNRYGAKWAAMRNAMNPNHYLECLAGWNPDSVWYKTFAKGLEDGERKMKRYVETSKQMLDEFARTHRNWLEVADGQGKNGIWYEVKVSPVAEWRKGDQPIFGEPITVYMTPLQKVHMYLESKNYDNLSHMLGGRVFADRELYSKGNKDEAFASDPIHLAPADVRRISSDLTEEEMELANILERYYNTYAKGEINKVSNELYGFDRAMAGNYAPIFTKDTYNTFTPAIIDGTAEGVGHMKTRIKGARTPTVNISAMDAFNKHVSQTSRFVGMSIPLHNMNGILNWTQNGKKMRSVIEQEWSKGDLKYIENLVTELQNPHFADEGYIEKTIDKIQSAYIGSVFGFNPSVALKVFGSWNLASAELGFENVKGAFTKVDPELIRKYTSEYDVRVRGYASPEVARLVNSQGKIEKLIQSNKVTKELFGGGMMIHTDAIVARSMWAWAEAAVRNENPDFEVGTQEQIDAGQSPFYKAVAERYNTAIGNTQSMYDIMHRSALLRDEGAVSRAFTMFHTDIMQAANLLMKAKGEHDYYRKALAADPENKALQVKAAKYEHSVGKAAAGVVTSSMLVAIVSVLNSLLKRRDEFYDENNEFMWDKFGTDYAIYILKDFFGMLPGVDVVAGGLIDHFRGEKWYDVEVMGLSLFNDLVDKGIKVAAKIVEGTATLEDYKDLAFLVARGFSLPFDNVERYMLGLFSWVAPEIGEAYNNLISPPNKSDLKGKSGEVLERDIYDMYKQFGLDRETTDELARLYELGYDKIIYVATPDHITIDGTEYELDDEAAERYSAALSETLSKVGEVISSDEYQEADDKERMGMLKRLNAYATETAKAAAIPEYDMSQWAESCKGLVDSGESIMTVAMMPYTEKTSSSSSGGGDDPRYVKLINAGVEYNNARDIEEKLTTLFPDAGKTNVSDFQKIKAIAEMPIPESDKAAALEVIAENTNFIRKLYNATASKCSLLEICDIYSAVIAKSEKGSFTQDNFKEVVSERGIPYDVASAIWLAKWEPKNNPYD